MGASFTNFQFRSAENTAVAKAVKQLSAARAYVSNAKDGWVSVYDEGCENQSGEEITRVAKGLSERLETAVFAFLVHDSDVFQYSVFEKGALRDEYNSDPDYFGEVSLEDRARSAGKTSLLIQFCKPGVDESVLRALLRQSTPAEDARSADPSSNCVFAEDQLRHLADLLGMVPARTAMGFSSFAEGEIEDGAGSRRCFKFIKSAGYEKVFKRNQKLIEAVRKGASAEVAALLAEGLPPDARASSGETALMIALGKGDIEISRQLIQAGANLHATDTVMGGTILSYAIVSDSPEVVKLVLNHGVNPSVIDGSGRTPLIKAIDLISLQRFSLEIIDLLVGAGADVNQAGDVQYILPPRVIYGITPIIWAVRWGNVNATRRLLELGANPVAKDAMAHARGKLKRVHDELLEADQMKPQFREAALRRLAARAADRELIVELLSAPTAHIQT